MGKCQCRRNSKTLKGNMLSPVHQGPTTARLEHSNTELQKKMT